jgi:hypothetical protein
MNEHPIMWNSQSSKFPPKFSVEYTKKYNFMRRNLVFYSARRALIEYI